MTAEMITTLVGSLGFPIVMCLYMAITQTKTLETLTKAIENNTIATEKLVSKMGGMSNANCFL